MKRLIVSVSAFTLAASLFAADTKPAAKDSGACCDKKMASSEKGSSACCSESSKKSACSKTPSKGIAMSPKAAALAKS